MISTVLIFFEYSKKYIVLKVYFIWYLLYFLPKEASKRPKGTFYLHEKIHLCTLLLKRNYSSKETIHEALIISCQWLLARDIYIELNQLFATFNYCNWIQNKIKWTFVDVISISLSYCHFKEKISKSSIKI